MPSAEPVAYAVTADQAQDIVLRSMLQVFPDVPVEMAAVPSPYVRYQARMEIAFDSHVIVATAAPVPGVSAYTFEVSDHGSLIIRGPKRAEAVEREISNRLIAAGAAVHQPR